MAAKKKDSGYQKELDLVLAQIGFVKTEGGTRIHVRVRQYNGGTAKVSVEEEGTRENGGKWNSRMKGIPCAHMVRLLPLLTKAAEFKAPEVSAPAADDTKAA